VRRLNHFPFRSLLVTDSVTQGLAPALPLEVCSVAPLLADAIGRLHRDKPLDDLLGSRLTVSYMRSGGLFVLVSGIGKWAEKGVLHA
jgi:hypothetical protein